MAAAQSLFPWGLCECYGRLSPTNISGAVSLVCEECGELTSPPDERTEADCDLFDIEQGKASAAELLASEGWSAPSAYGRDRTRIDNISTNEDINPFTRTTKY